MLFPGDRWYDVKQHRWEDGTLRETILHYSEPTALAIAGVHYEAPVWQHLHDETHHVSIRDGPAWAVSGGAHGATRCHMRLSSPETLTQLSGCGESCLRCLVLFVLLGPPLIYHDGSRLVPEEAVCPPLGRCGCVSTSPESWTGRRAVRLVYTTWGLAQVYMVLGGPRR